MIAVLAVLAMGTGALILGALGGISIADAVFFRPTVQ